MRQTCSIFAKIAVKKSKVVSPWIFIGAFFQQTWNIVVLQRNHCFVVRKWPFFPAPNPRKQPQQHFIISLCKNLVVFASILFTISSLNLPSRTSFSAINAVRLPITSHPPSHCMANQQIVGSRAENGHATVGERKRWRNRCFQPPHGSPPPTSVEGNVSFDFSTLPST